MNFLIVGSGPAGIFAAEAIRERDKERTITLVSQDTALACSPVMLTYWIAGERPQERLFFRGSSWAERNMIDVKLDCRAVGLDTGSQNLILSNGQRVPYHRMLIATGSSPISLPIPGVGAKGVGFLRSIRDSETIIGASSRLMEAVIIGGGFIGLKVACHLRERGVGVTVLEKEPKLAPRMLDQRASRMIANELRKRGIRVETDVEVAEILTEREWASGVRMKDGRVFSAQSIIQAVGVRPNAEFLADSGIDLHGGVLVNERMETNVSGVYAAGDVAMTVDSITSERVNNATWPAAARQGAVAGWNMTGGDRRYIHNFPLNATTLCDLRVMAAGHPYHEGGAGIEVFKTETALWYRKIVMRAGRLIGFILIGDVSGAGFLLSLMKKKAEIAHDPLDLLESRISPQDYVLPHLGYRHGDLFYVPGGKVILPEVLRDRHGRGC